MMAVNYTETSLSVMGRLARKSKHKEKGAVTGLTQCHYYGVQHEVDIHVCRLLQQFWPDWHQLHFAAVV